MVYEFQTKSANPHFENIFDIEPREVFENADQFTLIDVREPNEFVGELGHVQGSSLVVLHSIPEKLNTIPTEKPIIFICRSGGRSAQACAFAQHQGVKNTYNMRGGMMLWNSLQLPTVKD